mmetsp:Transcript_48354/g.121810  ORF Transcript_48354/g.121810 Transcript_48354/m.121810 type:complete len:364 (+) Transcript_48354:110-1201(+)
MVADRYAGGGEVVSTIFVGGFPPDALPRELDNLCRFMPGFVTSNVSTAKGHTTLFVLFDHPDNAYGAIELLSGQMYDRSQPSEPMRATMARSNMRSPNPAPAAHHAVPPPSRGWGGGAPPGQPPPPNSPPPQQSYPVNVSVADGGGSKRPRIPEDPSQVDTVASVGAKEAGFDEITLRAFYQQLPGFVDFKGNPRMGGGFAKFASADFALQAVEMARGEGIPAEMAKSSMGSSGGGNQLIPPRSATGQASNPGPTWGPGGGKSWESGSGSYGSEGSAKRPRIPEDPSQVDTVACVGAKEAGYDETALRDFFQQVPGYVTFKGNPRMGGGFVKFESATAAVDAVQVAREHGVPAEIAKSSMSST